MDKTDDVRSSREALGLARLRRHNGFAAFPAAVLAKGQSLLKQAVEATDFDSLESAVEKALHLSGGKEAVVHWPA
jgi:hypothetical protein